MGRPKKTSPQLRDTFFQVRLTVVERAELEQQAAHFDITLSELLRRRALGRRLPLPKAEEKANATMATALLRIGVNLNQIAKNMNAGRGMPMHLPNLVADIRAHVDRLTAYDSRQNRHG